MAEWSRATLWRQGRVFRDQTVDELNLRDPQMPGETIAVVISHDCDLAADPEKEPAVEVIVGRLIEKPDGNFTHAKTARVLHLGFVVSGQKKFVELMAVNKAAISKVVLADHSPVEDFQLDANGLSILQRWLAARYRRAAFPDAFEKRLKRSGTSDQLTRIIKPLEEHIPAIFFDVDEGHEVQREKQDDTYSLYIILLYASEPEAQEAERAALKAKQQIEDTFKAAFYDNEGRWENIELCGCTVMSDEALTYAQSTLFKQWRLEHLSLREEPQHSMMQE
jgi:hypothetical protein